MKITSKIDPCVGAVAKAGGLTDQEANDLLKEIHDIRKKAAAEGDIGRADERLRELGRSKAEQVKRAAALQRKHAALNAITRDAVDAHVEAFTAAGYTSEQGLTSLLIGSQKRVQGARKSVWATRQAYEGRYLGPVMGRIAKERPHLEKLLSAREWRGVLTPWRAPKPTKAALEFDAQVAREMEQIGKPDGKPGLTRNDDARFVANLLAETSELARRDLNALGADIGKLEGWLPHRHDADRVRLARREDWIAAIKPALDLQKTFPELDSARVDEVLGDIWANIVSGKDNLPTPGERGVRTGPANLAKSLGKERVLHFRDTDAYLTYNRKFGHGTTFATVMQHLRTSAHKAGLMKTLGPNPEVMWQSITQEASRLAREADPTSPMVQKLDRAGNWASWWVVSGQADAIHNQRTAKIGAGLRTWEQLSKLMGAVLSALPTDPVMMANAMRFQGKGVVSSYAGAFGKYFSGRGKGEQREIAFLLNEGYEGMFDAIVTPYAAMDGEVGKLANMARWGFRLQGLTGFTDVGRSVGARMMAAHFGENAGKGWDALDPRLKNVLTLQGFTPAKWEAVRQAAWKGNTGTTYLTPETIRTLPDEAVLDLAQDRLAGFDASKDPERAQRILDDTRRDLELDLRRLYADEIGFGIIETDDATRVVTTGGGLQRGTIGGEAARSVLQFKGFPVAFSQRVLGRRLMAAAGGTKGQRVLNGTLHMGELLATLTVAGIFAGWSKDVMKGRSPKSLISDDGGVNYKTIMAGFLQGGGAGIYGDFLFAESNRFGRSALATASGPIVGDVEALWSIVMSGKNDLAAIARGEKTETKASKAVNTALGLTPFVNLWYTRLALDYLFINSLREWASPGSQQRAARRMREDFGQQPLGQWMTGR